MKMLQEHDVLIPRGFIGMGTPRTWHGTLDERANWAPVHKLTSDCGESEPESDHSEGGKTTYEAKLSYT